MTRITPEEQAEYESYVRIVNAGGTLSRDQQYKMDRFKNILGAMRADQTYQGVSLEKMLKNLTGLT